MALLVSGCSVKSNDDQQKPVTDSGTVQTFCGPDPAAIEERVDTTLAGMTLPQKIAQMHGRQFAALDGLYYSGGDDQGQVLPFRMVDGPRGVRAGTATAFPVSVARGASFNRQLEHAIGEAIGAEARARGANVILAPTMNILRHPRWGRAQETYGEDPDHLGDMAVAFINGAQNHVVATAKHFAVNSIEATRFEVDVEVDERTLREVYLPHFRRAVQEAHVGAVMSAYNQVNGQYCSENHHLLREILKEQWDFQGLVMSDWLLGVNSTVGAAIGGLDIEMPMARFYGDSLLQAVLDGEDSEETIDEAVRRILRVKHCFPLADESTAHGHRLESAEHRALAQRAAEEGSVLLRNEDRTLPLDRDELSQLVIVGPLAQINNLGDGGSSAVVPSLAISPLDGLMQAVGDARITYIEGAESLTNADTQVISTADAVVVFAGLSAEDEGEGAIAAGDRTTLALSAPQTEMILAVAALNTRVIVVLQGGSAMLVEPWFEQVGAILLAWYPGQEGGHAIARLLLGDVNPSGKLPVSFPQAESALPVFDNVSPQVRYDGLHGYAYLAQNQTPARYPFGHGLSYTQFNYGTKGGDPQTISAACSSCIWSKGAVAELGIELTNSGAVAGTEVVQLYLSSPPFEGEARQMRLIHFERVSLDPGATKPVMLPITKRDLARFNVASGQWQVAAGSYGLEVGASSVDIRQRFTLHVRE